MALRGVCYKNVAIKAFVPEKMKILHSAIYAKGRDRTPDSIKDAKGYL
ncbi:hypothetical protein ACLK1T_01720 [Escherichia coli]